MPELRIKIKTEGKYFSEAHNWFQNNNLQFESLTEMIDMDRYPRLVASV